jgi:3-oxoacyl-[acyl-carrier-protein] synthase-1
MGIVSCLGNSLSEVCTALREGRSGIESLPERKELGFHSCLAGTIKNFESPEIPKRNLRQMSVSGAYATAAVREAIEVAGLEPELIENDRTGIIVGNTGNMADIFRNAYTMAHLKKSLPPGAVAQTMASSVSANLSVLLRTRGYAMTVSCACASGGSAIGQGAQLIRHGAQDRVLAGGVQEGSWEWSCNFDALRVFASDDGPPAEASRPFDRDRNGLVPSCGAGFVVLEELEQARARGATVLAELTGFASNSDGSDMTTPSGAGAVHCIRLALADAGIRPEDVDYVNAHATSTPVGDAVEARAIAEVFGDRPYVSGTKSMTGHETGAAGSNELIYTLLMMQHGFVAPTINVSQIDDDCRGIRLVTNQAVETPIRTAISNSFGFGGVNTCIVVTRHT